LFKIGVFINTHLNDHRSGNYRHGEKFAERFIDNYISMVENYKGYTPEYEVTVHIMDTGSTLKKFVDWIADVDYVKHLKIPNTGGYIASMKYVMHTEPEIMDDFDYFLFHEDDSAIINGNKWDEDMIEQYKKLPNGGIMGQKVRYINISKNGWNKTAPTTHISDIYGITKIFRSQILDADYCFLDKRTIKRLSEIWYDPIKSRAAIELQRKMEEMDFTELIKQHEKNRQKYHVGREIELTLRLRHFGMDILAYTGNKILYLENWK